MDGDAVEGDAGMLKKNTTVILEKADGKEKRPESVRQRAL
jgi:hypothetical protein